METVELTQEQVSGVIEKILEGAKQRYEAQALVSEADYFAGALTALTFLEEGPGYENLWEHTPAMWILGIMSGRSPTAIYIADGDEKVQRKIDKRMGYAVRLRENAEHMLAIVRAIADGDGGDGFSEEALYLINDIDQDYT